MVMADAVAKDSMSPLPMEMLAERICQPWQRAICCTTDVWCCAICNTQMLSRSKPSSTRCKKTTCMLITLKIYRAYNPVASCPRCFTMNRSHKNISLLHSNSFTSVQFLLPQLTPRWMCQENTCLHAFPSIFHKGKGTMARTTSLPGNMLCGCL